MRIDGEVQGHGFFCMQTVHTHSRTKFISFSFVVFYTLDRSPASFDDMNPLSYGFIHFCKLRARLRSYNTRSIVIDVADSRFRPYVCAYILVQHNYDKKNIDSYKPCSRAPLSNDTLDAQFLCDHYGGLLSDDEGSRVRVRSDVGRADGQVRNFECLDTVHVQAGIDDATSFARFHRTGTELAQSKTIKNNEAGV